MKFICLALCLLAVSISAQNNYIDFINDVAGTLKAKGQDTPVIPDVANSEDASEEYAEILGEITTYLNTHKVATSSVAVVNDESSDAMDFVKGFLIGISNASLFNDIKSCLNDTENVMGDLEVGINEIKTRNPAEVKNGIHLLGEALQIVPTAMQVCEAGEQDLKVIVKLVESFKDPEQFLYEIGRSLLINHVEVITEVENVVNAYNAKNFTSVGYWVGSAMATVVLGESDDEVVDIYTVAAPKDESDIIAFAEGFLDGFGSSSAFDALRACLSDAEDFGADMDQGMKDIETKDPAQVKAGIELLGKAAQIIPNAVAECRVAEANLQALIKAVESFTNPTAFLYFVGKSLLINHVEVIHEVENAVNAYLAKNYTSLGFWIGSTMATIVLGDDNILTQDFVDYLNRRPKMTWTAEISPKFEGMTLAEIKGKFLGTNLIDLKQFDNLTVYDYEGLDLDIPSSFNSSVQWPGCVHAIRDQGQCGSCWAFGASESLSDRLCVASNGSINFVLSPQYLISCNNLLNHGCNGGSLLFAWWFMVSTGLPTDQCLPYQSGNGTNPVTCKSFQTCQDGSQPKYYKGVKKSVVQLANPASIQANILQYGPVEAGMTVYQDFMDYKGGVYTHSSGSELGGHAVKIIGWGVENNVNFWIVANSWGVSWGEDGFFRIAFGQCGIDSGVVTGQADVSSATTTENRFFW